MTTRRPALLDQYFYFFMSLLIAVVVVYGFSHTVGENLIRPALPGPFVLYLHAAVFSGWVLFYILQSTLVRTNNVGLHRRIGWFGVALGVMISVLGISTAVTMARFRILHFNATEAESFIIVSFFDIIAFSIPLCWPSIGERSLSSIAPCS